MKKLSAVLMSLAACTLMAAPAMAYQSFTGPLGVLYHDQERALDGYTLVTPQDSKISYLVDMKGNLIQKWQSEYIGFWAELLPNGNLLRHSVLPDVTPNIFGGTAGLFEEFDWTGKKVWELKVFEPGKEVSHHTFEIMPNGNLMFLVWEHKTADEAYAKGRDPKNPDNRVTDKGVTDRGETVTGIWPDVIREVDRKTNKVVWEWKVWDNIGTGADQFDINTYLPVRYHDVYAGPDWTHFNGVAFNPRTNQVAFTSRNFGEVYVVDYATKKMVYRWGNPANYGQGKAPAGYSDDGDQKLFGPHAPDWTAENTITVLDNGSARPTDNYTRGVELDPKTSTVVWEWKPSNVNANVSNFYSKYQCGVQKLANGNYLLTASQDGHVIEVANDKNLVWEFVNPFLKGVPFAASSPNGAPGGMVHKALRYAKDWPGFQGKDLSSKGSVLPEGTPNWLELLSTSAKTPNKPLPKK